VFIEPRSDRHIVIAEARDELLAARLKTDGLAAGPFIELRQNLALQRGVTDARHRELCAQPRCEREDVATVPPAEDEFTSVVLAAFEVEFTERAEADAVECASDGECRAPHVFLPHKRAIQRNSFRLFRAELPRAARIQDLDSAAA
jgi:hypothetical protein